MTLDPESTKATASVVGKAFDTVRDGAKAVGLGPLANDLLGLAVADRARHARIRNEAKLQQDTARILADRGVSEVVPISPAMGEPLVEAAAGESREELQALWAQLLANALDPARADSLRIEFIETLRRLHPRDALIMKMMASSPGSMQPDVLSYLAAQLKLTVVSVDVSLRNLTKLDCVTATASGGFYLAAFGKELLSACAP